MVKSKHFATTAPQALPLPKMLLKFKRTYIYPIYIYISVKNVPTFRLSTRAHVKAKIEEKLRAKLDRDRAGQGIGIGIGDYSYWVCR